LQDYPGRCESEGFPLCGQEPLLVPDVFRYEKYQHFLLPKKYCFLKGFCCLLFIVLYPCADDLPIWGIVGEIDEKEDAFYIWTHKKFEIGYNRDQVRIIPYAVPTSLKNY
jgi:hypothetical protein